MRKIIFAVVAVLVAFSFSEDTFAEKEKWSEYKKQHFIVYYKKAPFEFVETVEKTAEEYYSEISSNLGFTRYKGWTWEERAKIYIYDDSEDYQLNARAYNWSHGIANPSSKIIRTFPSAHGFFDSTLPHELGHIIFREFVGLYARVPLWLEEGVAMYQEKAKRWGANKSVLESIKDETFLTLTELSSLRLDSRTEVEKVHLFYDESASIVYYLISEFGQFRFANFCRALKEGNNFEDALAKAYIRFKKLDDLNRAWMNYLKK